MEWEGVLGGGGWGGGGGVGVGSGVLLRHERPSSQTRIPHTHATKLCAYRFAAAAGDDMAGSSWGLVSERLTPLWQGATSRGEMSAGCEFPASTRNFGAGMPHAAGSPSLVFASRRSFNSRSTVNTSSCRWRGNGWESVLATAVRAADARSPSTAGARVGCRSRVDRVPTTAWTVGRKLGPGVDLWGAGFHRGWQRWVCVSGGE